MKHIDQTEWDQLKLHSSRHLRSPFWQSGSFCVAPAERDGRPVVAPEVWAPPVSSSPLHLEL